MRNICGSTATSATYQAHCKPPSGLRWDINGRDGRLTKRRQKPEGTWSPGQSEGHTTAQSRLLGWGWRQLRLHGASGPRPAVPKAQPQWRVVRAQGRGGQARAPDREAQGFVEGGRAQRPRAETKVLSALLLRTEAFQRRVPCPQSSSPAVRKRVSLGLGTRAGAGTRGLHPTPGPLSEQPPSPFL